ncbi:hypothetical protein Tco_1180769 [Tanacetum coccineum]
MDVMPRQQWLPSSALNPNTLMFIPSVYLDEEKEARKDMILLSGLSMWRKTHAMDESRIYRKALKIVNVKLLPTNLPPLLPQPNFFHGSPTSKLNLRVSMAVASTFIVMSSPNHPTSNIEDAFSSNFLDYISASLDYSPASPGNTYSSSSNNSFGLVPIASPTLLLFHDDPYMKVMQAYYAKESHIPLPTIMPPSPMLSPIFNPQEFFLPEELLPPKK